MVNVIGRWQPHFIGLPPPLLAPPVAVVPIAYTVEGEPGWHLPADHDDPVEIVVEGVVIVLWVVIWIGIWGAVVRFVRRPLSS